MLMSTLLRAYITSSPAKSYASLIVTVLEVGGFRGAPPGCKYREAHHEDTYTLVSSYWGIHYGYI